MIEKINKTIKTPTQPGNPIPNKTLVLKNLICKSNNFVPLGREEEGPGGGEEWGGEAGRELGELGGRKEWGSAGEERECMCVCVSCFI